MGANAKALPMDVRFRDVESVQLRIGSFRDKPRPGEQRLCEPVFEVGFPRQLGAFNAETCRCTRRALIELDDANDSEALKKSCRP